MRASVWISDVTAYDYPTALLMDRAGVEMFLVGDSVGMTVLGYETTLPVTMEEMLIFTSAVCRAVEHAFVIGDMPYMSYQASTQEAIRNAGRFMAQCGTDAVKLEGGARIAPVTGGACRGLGLDRKAAGALGAPLRCRRRIRGGTEGAR